MLKTRYGDIPAEIDPITGRARLVRNTQGSGERGHGTRVNNHSVGDPSPSHSPHYASKTEAAYAQYLDSMKHAGELARWWYQPFILRLPGGVRYRPDFLIEPAPGGFWHASAGGLLIIDEVKGWSKNVRDGVTRFKIAAGLFPCWTWRLVKSDVRVPSGWLYREWTL